MDKQFLPDNIVLIYAIQEYATKPMGTGAYYIVPILTAEKNKNGKYQFAENAFTNIYDVVERIVLSNSKWQKFKYWLYTSFTGITVNDDELRLVIDNIPKYINDPKYSGPNHICKYLFTSKEAAEIKLQELLKPVKIKHLKNAIEDIEMLHERINVLKDMLWDLEH